MNLPTWKAWISAAICFDVWMCMTGLGGLALFCKLTNTKVCVFMCSSILSSVMGVVIIILFSIFIANAGDVSPCRGYDCKGRKKEEEFRLAISVIILALGATEFVVGVLAAICCCALGGSLVPRVIHHPIQEAQQVTANPTQDVMSQVPDDVPVGVPVRAEGGKVTVQASGAQGVHAAMVLEPVPEAVGVETRRISLLGSKQVQSGSWIAGNDIYPNVEIPVKT